MSITKDKLLIFKEMYENLPALPRRPVENTSIDPENEEWRPVLSIYIYGVDENKYEVSSFGRVRDITTNTLVDIISDGRGYASVRLTTSRLTTAGRRDKYAIIKVHRLVMLHFKFRPDCYLLDVDHKNTLKVDNHLWNLEWVTPKENIKRAIFNGDIHSITEVTLSDNDAYNLFVDIFRFNNETSNYDTIEEILNVYHVTKEYAEYLFYGKIKPHITYYFYKNYLMLQPNIYY